MPRQPLGLLLSDGNQSLPISGSNAGAILVANSLVLDLKS
jgi:hypothetical protein